MVASAERVIMKESDDIGVGITSQNVKNKRMRWARYSEMWWGGGERERQ